MSTLFLTCDNMLRTCSQPVEYFDYGLWLPPLEKAKKVEAAEESFESESDEVSEGTRKAAAAKAAAAAIPKAVVDEKKKAFETKYGPTATVDQAVAEAQLEGFAPSMQDLKALHEKHGDKISFADYRIWQTSIQHTEDTEKHLVAFFELYDVNKSGFVTKRQVQNLLMNFGEPMTEAEVAGIFTAFNITGNEVDYHDFCKRLLE
eukprot:Lankesteria_metandrocarpae@DN2098_c0_g1_i1.p1